jgi:hypothetical protein
MAITPHPQGGDVIMPPAVYDEQAEQESLVNAIAKPNLRHPYGLRQNSHLSCRSGR